jgi:altronate hydrolase
LVIGLECGGSDGFSGITANPLLGEISDLICALGGSSILAEFPELAGMEHEIINRCINESCARRFMDYFQAYAERARAIGAGFEQNPSPGNIREGLVTLTMKSAGAVRKGGYGIVNDVLDYTEQVHSSGLNLLCTPGNDVESTTALAASGANIILFTTGLGTPTGNPIVPVIKVSSNTELYVKMNDIIDFDAGQMISNGRSVMDLRDELMEYIIEVAGGRKTRAMQLGQHDFIPWKRGISL